MAEAYATGSPAAALERAIVVLGSGTAKRTDIATALRVAGFGSIECSAFAQTTDVLRSRPDLPLLVCDIQMLDSPGGRGSMRRLRRQFRA